MSADNLPQRESKAYRLAALDQDFMLGDSMRGVRFLLEYAKAEENLRAWGVRSTIVVFGSARVREDGPEKSRRWYLAAAWRSRPFMLSALRRRRLTRRSKQNRLQRSPPSQHPALFRSLCWLRRQKAKRFPRIFKTR